MLFDNRLTIDDLSRATNMQRIAHELYGDGETPQRELDALIGAKSGNAVAMRLHRMRQRLGIARKQTRPRPRTRVLFHQLSMFDGL
jgi:hypothetical protein